MAWARAIEIGGLVDAPIFIRELNGQRRADGFATADARENIDDVFFDFLPAATAITALAAEEFVIGGFEVEGKASRQPFNECNKSLPVRFARGSVFECAHQDILSGRGAGGEGRRGRRKITTSE